MSTQSQLSQPTTTAPAADAQTTQITNNPISAAPAAAQDPNQPETLESAIAEVKRLTAKRDQLLKEKAKADKEIERITKNTRLQTLKTLVPPELFHRSDLYEQELEKVYSWKGLSDDDIRDIYQVKLRNIDLGRARALKQHGASTSTTGGGFPNIFSNFSSFRDVPHFSDMTANQERVAASERVKKSFDLLKRIANGSGSTRIE
jgi:hypothetical protein